MKVRAQTEVTHEGNLGQIRKIKQGMDQNSMVHLMGLLGNPYSDLLLAIHREYAANAADSHAEAGNTAPIEIEMPTELRPTFVVRDHGVGMSLDDLENFMLYGFSSKRETDEQVGYFGIGCKCGLNLANQFTIVSVKGGVKVTAVMTKADDGVGELDILDTVGTTEPNGVEIKMPIPQERMAEFIETGLKFYRFWAPGTVLIDGEPPESIYDDTLEIDPDVHLVKGLNSHYVVMGNIPYPLPASTKFNNLSNGWHVVANVDIGSVKLTPSRESLDLSKDVSKDTLRTLVAFVDERMGTHVQKEIDACPTHLDALKLAAAWRSGSWTLRLTYRGEKIPSDIMVSGQKWNISSWSSRKAETLSYIGKQQITNSRLVLITGHPRRSMTSETKEAIYRKYGQTHDIAYVVHRFEPGMKQWVEGLTTITFQELCPPAPKIKLPKAPRQKKKWEIWDPSLRRFVDTEKDDLPTGRMVYILRNHGYRSLGISTYKWRGHYSSEWTKEDYREHLGRMLSEADFDVSLAMIATTDKERFLRIYPQAMTLEEFFQPELYAVTDQLTPDARNWDGSHPLMGLDPGKVLDPKIKSLVRRINAVTNPKVRTLQAQRTALLENAERFTGKPIKDRAPVPSDFQKALKAWGVDYPLLKRCGDYGREVTRVTDDILDHLNAMYLYRKTKGQKQ